MTMELWGAAAFGVVLGWNLYFVNRYRTDRVRLVDLGALVGVIGGGAVLALFPAGSRLFGAYGIGLLAGFTAYLLVLFVLVAVSKKFTFDWFLDGRRLRLAEDEEKPPGARDSGVAMSPTQRRRPG